MAVAAILAKTFLYEDWTALSSEQALNNPGFNRSNNNLLALRYGVILEHT